MSDLKPFEDILDKIISDGEDELKDAAKEVLKIGRGAFQDFLNDIKDDLTSEDAKRLAELYAEAEAKILAYNSTSARRVMKRLNLISRTFYNINRSQNAKRAIISWRQALRILTSLVSRLGSIGAEALSGLAGEAVKAGSDLVDEVAGEAEKALSSKKTKKVKKKKSQKKKKKKKKTTSTTTKKIVEDDDGKDGPITDDLVIEDDESGDKESS